MPSALHQERLEIVAQALIDAGARTVLDLGCGPGELMLLLSAHAQFERIVGLDTDAEPLDQARAVLGLPLVDRNGRIQLRRGSFEDASPELCGFDAAAMVETLEHIDPGRLTRVERAVFGAMRPTLVLVTTPNQDYNEIHGMAPGERRHPGHRFEWSRARFRHWAGGVARRQGYRVEFTDIGPLHPRRGSSTQMARFQRL